MVTTVIAIALGLVISAACIGIPQLVRIRSQRPDDNSREYMRQTGRSPAEIAEENAAVLAREEEEADRSRRPGSTAADPAAADPAADGPAAAGPGGPG